MDNYLVKKPGVGEVCVFYDVIADKEGECKRDGAVVNIDAGCRNPLKCPKVEKVLEVMV